VPKLTPPTYGHKQPLLRSVVCTSLLFFFFATAGYAQSSKADSLQAALRIEKADTNKVNLMWQLGGELTNSKPDDALLLTQRSLLLARKINYIAGQSRALAVLANTFLNLGNYPKALEYNLQRLKIEEKRNIPANLASVLINTGIVYVMEEDYENALLYYRKSDSVIQLYNVTDYDYNINVNKGDVFDKLNRMDSAYRYYEHSLQIAREQQNDDFIGASMTGIAHYYRKTNQFDSAVQYYHNAVAYLQKANDDLITCEATLGLAKLFHQYGQADSAVFYASLSNSIAIKSGFVSEQLKSSDFLKVFYREQKNIDSAFHYYNTVLVLNDSINNKNRLRDIQFITINEQMRQVQIEEEKLAAKEERRQQLQLLFIAIFIPGFFLVTLLLSRIRIPIRLIKIMGILSLLIFFEFLTLLLHPTVKEFTHHTPIYEIMIFVAIAAILIPTHHRIEHWLIEKLLRNREQLAGDEKKIRIKQSKIKLQLNPDENNEKTE
jgi:tetratricopeptide (TPR) repeat protein